MKRIKIITSKGELTFEVDKEEVFIDCVECDKGVITYNKTMNAGSTMADAYVEEVTDTCNECDGEGWMNLKELLV